MPLNAELSQKAEISEHHLRRWLKPKNIINNRKLKAIYSVYQCILLCCAKPSDVESYQVEHKSWTELINWTCMDVPQTKGMTSVQCHRTRRGIMIDGDVDNTPVWCLLLNNTKCQGSLFFFPHSSSPASRQGMGKRLGGAELGQLTLIG